MPEFIVHPSSVPIEVNLEGGAVAPRRAHAGGLSLTCALSLPVGAMVRVRIPRPYSGFEARAQVLWCRAQGQGYELGVAFEDTEDLLRARIVEQACHIEAYRMAVRTGQGRELSVQEAALEWIERFAADFPRPEGAG